MRRLFSNSGFWLVAWLTVIDIGINLACCSSSSLSSSSLRRYFDLGRSVESKLAHMVAASPVGDGQLLSAGWFNPEVLETLPDSPGDGSDLLMAIYGQSFTYMAAMEAARMDPQLTVRAVIGPNAPPSHSYAAYKADVSYRKADVVVFGILSSSIVQMGSLSALISLFENPPPFTFPRYRLIDGQLQAGGTPTDPQ
jgi:hypothetical protein